jgi:hypothetical protein
MKSALIESHSGLLGVRLFAIRRKYQAGCPLDQEQSITVANRAIFGARIAVESSFIYTISFIPLLALGLPRHTLDSPKDLFLLGLRSNVCPAPKLLHPDVNNSGLMLFCRLFKSFP